jgi:hypothetical protein
MSHNIIKRGTKDFYCSVCHQQWTAPSKAHCPQLPVIAFSHRGTWMSQTELNHRGYRTKTLPEPIACYRTSDTNHSVVYVWLYDPALCERKTPTTRLRTLLYVDNLQWPVSWLTVFEKSIEYRDMLDEKAQRALDHDPQQYRDPRWQSIAREIAECASSLVFFSQDEAALLVGEMIPLSFPLLAIRRQWADGWHRQTDMHKVVQSLEKAYKEHQWRMRPRLSEDQLQELTLKREARTQEMIVKEAERRARLFDLPDWITLHDRLGPAKQKGLFGEEEIPF